MKLLLWLTIVSLATCIQDDVSDPLRSFAPHVASTVRQNLHRVNHQSPASFAAPVLPLTALETALKYLERVEPGFARDEWHVTSQYKSRTSGVTHIYLRQSLNGLQIVNADINVNIDKHGHVLTHGSSAFTAHTSLTGFLASHKPRLSAWHAVSLYAQTIGVEFPAPQPGWEQPDNDKMVVTLPAQPTAPLGRDSLEVRLAYFQSQSDDDSTPRLNLVWEFHADISSEHSYEVFVDAVQGKVIAQLDWIHHFADPQELDQKWKPFHADPVSYWVFDVPVLDPLRGLGHLVRNPPNQRVGGSPLGWHAQSPTLRFNTTMGNNAMAQENLRGLEDDSWRTNYRPEVDVDVADGLHFNVSYDTRKSPTDNVDASITNLFYWTNLMHDIFYVYGFDEVSGNFQENNFDLGGKEGDAVQANALDGHGINNANFLTPPDGQRPRMRMYQWAGEPVNRDGDIDSSIIVHEYAHGISTRLTGGPENVHCLRGGQSGGMGEGWGDCFALFLMAHPFAKREEPIGMGAYASGNINGIRKYPYTTDMSMNPHTYADVNEIWGSHGQGTVWCSILYEAFWNVIDLDGFSNDWYEGTGGNNQFMQNVVDGMKLQPCRPTFIQARDAIMLADDINYDGKNKCAMWKGFAKRGMGVDAEFDGRTVVNGFSLPSECSGHHRSDNSDDDPVAADQ